MQRKALGRGLEALIPSKGDSIIFISVDRIVPNRYQPRKSFGEEEITSLAKSIKDEGLLQPIVVKPTDEGYEVVIGERRWRAARKAGLTEIPAIVKDVDGEQQLKLALVENLQREELNPIERATGYKMLIEKFSLSQKEVAEIVGKERSSIANTLRLLRLPQNLQDEIAEGKISEGHGRVLLSLPEEERKKLYRKLKEKTLTVREAEKIARKRKGSKTKSPNIQDIEERLQRLLATKVYVKTGRQKGSIIIEYYSSDDLDRILEIFGVKS